MAKGKKFRAALPDGSFASRGSENRTYLFCVAYRTSYSHALMQAKQLLDVDRSNYAFHVRESAAETAQYSPSKASWRGSETDAEYFAKHRAEIKGCATAGEYQKALINQRVYAVEAAKERGAYDLWRVEGWQSRYDLAVKLAAKLRNSPYYSEVAICAAEEV